MTLTPDTFFLSRYQLNNGDPWSFMVTPGGDTYDFTLASGDMRIAKSGISTYAWNLLNGAFTGTVVGTQNTFHVLTPVSLSNSEPIKRSTITSTSSTFNNTSCIISGINSGVSFPPNTPVLVTNDPGVLVFELYTRAPLIIPKNVTISIGAAGTVNYNGISYSFITAVANDIKYSNGLSPNPYVLNDPI